MEYGSNILKTEAAYYELSNASISNGILTIRPGGRAACTLDASYIAKLSEYFQVNLVANPIADRYVPKTFVNINVTTLSGNTFSYSLFPTVFSSGVYSAEIQLEAGEYRDFVFEIVSYETISFTIWELCPEAVSDDIQVIIEGVTQSLPKLLFDYNTVPISIGEAEEAIAIITCKLLERTDLQGHLLLNYSASDTCTITLRFRDNEATELFCPLLYDVQAGRGTIGVPHSYLHRLAGYHNFVVSAQCSVGNVAFGTRGILFTIDGGYLAERATDIGTNISDITIENKENDTAPRYIWIISVETGELLVRRRAYSALSSGVSFEPMFSLGPAIDGAIEFDGDWDIERKHANALYRLNTYDDPYCFIVDTNNKLYVQRGGDADTRLLLDTDVTAVSACRGFKSMYFPKQDQGLVVLYIKNGKAFYRQYTYLELTDSYSWLAPVELTEITGKVLSVNVHRLNDYRVGFAVTTENSNYWLLSDRTYVGQAHKPEVANFYPKNYTSIGLFSVGNTPDTVQVTECILSDDRLSILASFNYPVRCVDADPTKHLALDSWIVQNLDEIKVVDGGLVIKLKKPVYAVYSIVLNHMYAWQYYAGNNWVALREDIALVYDPYGHIDTAHTDHAIINVSSFSPTIALNKLRSISGLHADTATFNVAAQTEIVQRPLVFSEMHCSDAAAFTPSVEVSLTLSLVGTTPI